MVTCKECGHECSAKNALGYHLRLHGMAYVDYVVKHEHGGAWPCCPTCNSKLRHKKGGFSRFCSKSCAASGENNPMHGRRGELSPILGIRRTSEQLLNYSTGANKRWEVHGDALRQMMSTPEYRQAQRESQKESYVQDPTRRERVSNSINAFWSDPERSKDSRKAASARAVALLQQGKIGPQAPFRTEWKWNPFTGREEYMHSSWESAFLDRCIAEGLAVTKDHGLSIPYVQADGIEHAYLPDFVNVERGVVFELKGYDDPAIEVPKLAHLQAWGEENGYRVVKLRAKDRHRLEKGFVECT